MIGNSIIGEIKAMVVGCGALGNEVMKNLVLMGVRHFTIVDFDLIEQGNLTRSILYRRKDVGEPKVEVARKALLDINPDIEVQTINGDIAHDVGLATILRMDIIIGCVDSRWARYCIQRLCLRVGKTWVDGGILNLEGTVRVFTPGKNCYACSLGDEGLKELRRRMPCSGVIRRQELAGHAPTTPIIASIIGAVMVQEALKVLGDGNSVMVDGTTNHQHPTPNTQPPTTNHQHPTPNPHHPTPITQPPKMFYYEGESMTARTPIFDAWDDDCALHDEWGLGELDDTRRLERNQPLSELDLPGTLILNEPFVDYIVNRRTDQRFDAMLPAHRVEDFLAHHPKLKGYLSSDFYQHEYREIDESFPYSNLTISNLGIPKDDILRFRRDKQYIYALTD